MSFDPLPETREALSQIGEHLDEDLSAELLERADLIEDIVPNLVGMSLALVEEGVTFTVAATRERIALLDAIQYAVGGPCVDAALDDATILSGDNDEGLLDERRWAQFARAGAAHGVQSTLSLPLHHDGSVIGGVNLYAAEPDAFAGREDQIAHLLGAWAPGAVHNADLTFSTRTAARQAPGVLAERAVLDQATGVVVAAHGVDPQRAREIITDAAHRSGQDELDVARALVRSLERPHDEDLDPDLR